MKDPMFKAMEPMMDLDALDRESRELLLDFRAAEVGPALPPIVDLDELRGRLKVVKGALITLPSGTVRDAAELIGIEGESNGINDWVATELGAVAAPNPIQQNALGCARLWADEAPWDGIDDLFNASKRAGNEATKAAANHNLSVLYEARVASDGG